MGRSVPYDEDEICDICGKKGAYDFMGDYICEYCSGSVKQKNWLRDALEKNKNTK